MSVALDRPDPLDRTVLRDLADARAARGLPPAAPDPAIRPGDWVRAERSLASHGRLLYVLLREDDGHLVCSDDGVQVRLRRDQVERVPELGPHGLKAGDRVRLLCAERARRYGRSGTIAAIHGRAFMVRFDDGAERLMPYWLFDPEAPARWHATVPRAAARADDAATAVGDDRPPVVADDHRDRFHFDPEPPRAA